MAKYRNRYGEVSEFEDSTTFFSKHEANTRRLHMYFTHYWLPLLYREAEEMTAPNNALLEYWQNYKYPQDQLYKQIFYPIKRYFDDLKRRNIAVKDFSKTIMNEYEYFTKNFTPNRNVWAGAYFQNGYNLSLFIGKANSHDDFRNRALNFFRKLEETYSYDPELERQQQEQKRMQEFENSRVKELDAHIQQLNKNLEVSQQQNSRLQQNVDYLNREQNRIINETRNSFQQQANKLAEFGKQTQSSITRLSQESQSAFNRTQEDTSRAFNQFQKTVEENLRKRGEDYDRNLENFRTSAENELSNIKQNHGVLMEKLRNRMKRRMLSDAPEMKASYNFFADIFAGNK